MSHIDNLIEFAETSADDWNWPIGVVKGAKQEIRDLHVAIILADQMMGLLWKDEPSRTAYEKARKKVKI